MKDPYAVVSCAHCGHKMISESYRNVIHPDDSTPIDNIHIHIDESLPAPQTYGCPCGHFTVIGKAKHLERYLRRNENER
jgi:hypothetical protein